MPNPHLNIGENIMSHEALVVSWNRLKAIQDAVANTQAYLYGEFPDVHVNYDQTKPVIPATETRVSQAALRGVATFPVTDENFPDQLKASADATALNTQANPEEVKRQQMLNGARGDIEAIL